MPKLIYSIDCAASPLEIAAQALAVVRVLEYAQKKGLAFEEFDRRSDQRRFVLAIPLDELNSVLDELLFAGLLLPLQEILGRPSAHTILHERFSALTWVDEGEYAETGLEHSRQTLFKATTIVAPVRLVLWLD